MRYLGRPRGIRFPVVRGSATARLLGIPDSVDYRRGITAAARHAERTGLVQLKPGRVPGACWMDGYVSARRVVNLCTFCVGKYGQALTSREYRVQPAWIADLYSDCDGCGSSTLKVTRYIPAEKYLSLLLGPPKRIAQITGGSK